MKEHEVRQIYLDYNATAPIAPSVVEAMTPFLSDHYGNPSSSHALGRAAKEAIQDARVQVAGLLACDQDEIIFTSGGTESNNLAIKGTMFQGTPGTGHLIISAFEHPSVANPAAFLERIGYDVSIVPCDADGIVQPEFVEREIRSDTRLVSIMHANNEIGTIQPIRKIAEICHSRGVLIHTDASQSGGKIPTLVDVLDIDLMTLAGHKLYAPKGIGILYVRDGLTLEPHNHGADHERGIRAGTENTPYIIGLGHAAFMASRCLEEAGDRMSVLRDQLQSKLTQAIGSELIIPGGNSKRLPNTLNVIFPGVEGQDLLRRANQICASTGSACNSDGSHGSTTLAAIGINAAQARCAVRISIGWYTSEEDVERAANMLIDAWEVLRTTTV